MTQAAVLKITRISEINSIHYFQVAEAVPKTVPHKNSPLNRASN